MEDKVKYGDEVFDLYQVKLFITSLEAPWPCFDQKQIFLYTEKFQ